MGEEFNPAEVNSVAKKLCLLFEERKKAILGKSYKTPAKHYGVAKWKDAAEVVLREKSDPETFLSIAFSDYGSGHGPCATMVYGKCAVAKIGAKLRNIYGFEGDGKSYTTLDRVRDELSTCFLMIKNMMRNHDMSEEDVMSRIAEPWCLTPPLIRAVCCFGHLESGKLLCKAALEEAKKDPQLIWDLHKIKAPVYETIEWLQEIEQKFKPEK